MNKPCNILGLMSGTSLDGVDLALCEFTENGPISFKLLAGQTIPYNANWKRRLTDAFHLSARDFQLLNHEYGVYLSLLIIDFLKEHPYPVTGIASHGHTIFHEPAKGFTTQIGSGSAISAVTGLTTVCDFRSLDAALGGQGAPLVPIGDRLLFSEYDACLNLGGIANISITHGTTIAFDITAANMALNELAQRLGHPYDDNGSIARSGKIDAGILQSINELEYFKRTGPRSIGREWYESSLQPLLKSGHVPDLLATCIEQIAMQVAKVTKEYPVKKMLVTGGGAHNGFLIERIRHHAKVGLHIPPKDIIDYKEAIVFALLGYLRLNNKVNTLSSVTGANCDSVGGAIYFGTSQAK